MLISLALELVPHGAFYTCLGYLGTKNHDVSEYFVPKQREKKKVELTYQDY